MKIYAEDPALEEIEARDSFRRFPVLDQKEGGRCVFLDDRNQCSIYPIRPLVCRRFPLSLGEDLARARWAGGCVPKKAGDSELLVKALVENHQAKLDDLWLLETSLDTLRVLGIFKYLPRAGREPDSF